MLVQDPATQPRLHVEAAMNGRPSTDREPCPIASEYEGFVFLCPFYVDEAHEHDPNRVYATTAADAEATR